MLGFFFPILAFAAFLELDPHALDAKTKQYKGPHFAAWEENTKPNGLLLLSIGGTDSKPQDLRAFDEEAAKLGYQTIGLDYVNGPPDGSISTACRISTDRKCFDTFRREIVKGEPVNPLVKVDQANSIEHRAQLLLQALAKKDPPRWKKFLLATGKIDWHKVVVAGHSQGSGHAAFLAKLHELRGAVLLAGPQDSFADGQTASWLDLPSRTPTDRFYSFLHEKDFFDSAKQIAVARVLMHKPSAPATVIPPEGCAHLTSHILVTNRTDVGDAHMSLIQPVFKDVWKHILDEQVGK